jgi:2-succinyl-5-enolpyruvyl-6-hydroxy-3-cyclohexene-1-carboxylate synthase
VHLNVAWRDPLGPEPRPDDVTASTALALEGRTGARPLTTVAAPAAAPAEELVGALAERLAAPRGLIVAGRMADRWAVEPIAALAVATGYPILAEPTSQLRFGPHDRGLVLSHYEPIARARPRELTPELVLRFGEMPTCKPLRQWLADLPEAAQLVIDPDRGWNEPSRIAGAIVRGDPARLAATLAERADGDPDPTWAGAWLAAAKAAGEAIENELAGLDEATEPGIHAALGRLYADGDLVYTASSMPIRDQEAFLARGPAEVRFLANRGANGIDGLISSGIGAAAATGRPTWIVTGDLGLFHDMNALAALRHAKGPVRIVVLDNDGGGIFEFLPQAGQIAREEFEAILGTPLGLDPERVAALHGIPFVRVTDPSQLAVAGATALIHVPVDRTANRALHERLGETAETAVTEALGGSSSP